MIKVPKKKYCLLQGIRSCSINGRWQHIDNFHLTLKFLGEVDETRIDVLNSALLKAASSTKSFSIIPKGLGCFDVGKQLRVVWLGIDGEIEKLNNLQGLVENNLSIVGFDKENRRYSPHVTLAKDVLLQGNFEQIKQLEENYNFESINIEKLVLIKSEQIGNKRIYTVIREFVLGE